LKKLILVIAALVMVASGVAAVSAYEAHVVNITAKVENALILQHGTTTDADAPLKLELGTVFPQEWIKEHIQISLSDSFKNEDDVDNLTYELWAEWKKIPSGTTTVCKETYNTVDYYCWMGDALWVGTGDDWPGDVVGDPTDNDGGTVSCPAGSTPGTPLVGPGGLKLIGPAPTFPTMAVRVPGFQDTLVKGVKESVEIGIGLDVPAFEYFYNPDTDVCPKPSLRDSPTLVIDKEDEGTGPDSRYHPDGVDLGIDLKVQVIDIGRP
jgi:hypothetical protein